MRGVFLWLATLTILLTGPALAASWTGRGNEPSWQVEVSDGAVRFSSLDGESVTLDPVPEPALAEGVTVYLGETDGASLALVATEKICSDTMSGMPHPKTVVVITGDKVFLGCGGDPLSLLLGEWQVDEIEGAAVLAKTDPSLGFDADGSFHGSTSCNRYFGSFALTGEALTLSPTGRPSLVGAWAAAWDVIGTRSVSFRRPSLSASKVRYSVMILVTDAG